MRVLLALALLAYPLALYALRDSVSPVALAILFALLLGARLLLADELSKLATGLSLAALAVLCGVTASVGSVAPLKLYPVVFSALAALWCGYTLTTDTSAIHRLLLAASRSKARLPEAVRKHIPLNDAESASNPSIAQRVYMRGLTAVWTGFFIINGIVSAYISLTAGTGLWALYNGAVSYGIVLVLLLGEPLYRGVYQRRHNHIAS